MLSPEAHCLNSANSTFFTSQGCWNIQHFWIESILAVRERKKMFYTSLWRHCEGSGSHPRIQHSLQCVLSVILFVWLYVYNVLMHSSGTTTNKERHRGLYLVWHSSAQVSLLVSVKRHFHTRHKHSAIRKCTQPLCVLMGALVLKWGVARYTVGTLLSWGSRKQLGHRPMKTCLKSMEQHYS